MWTTNSETALLHHLSLLENLERFSVSNVRQTTPLVTRLGSLRRLVDLSISGEYGDMHAREPRDFDPIDWEGEGVSDPFPVLTDLSISDCEMTGLLHLLHRLAGRLERFTVMNAAWGVNGPITNVQALIQALLRFDSLQIFRLHNLSGNIRLPLGHLQPLRKRCAIEELKLQTEVVELCEAESLARFFAPWTSLTTLDLGMGSRSPNSIRPSIVVLEQISQGCPNLSSITIAVDARRGEIPEIPEFPDPADPPRCILNRIVLGHSPIDDPEAVLNYIAHHLAWSARSGNEPQFWALGGLTFKQWKMWDEVNRHLPNVLSRIRYETAVTRDGYMELADKYEILRGQLEQTTQTLRTVVTAAWGTLGAEIDNVQPLQR